MIHNKQYIIGKSAYIIDDSWQTINLPNGYCISYQNNLHITYNKDKSIVLLGDAWQVEPNRISPGEIILDWDNSTSLEKIQEQEETWNGRYILITDKYILPDTTCGLCCFYNNHTYSSSLALLQIIKQESIKGLPKMPMDCPPCADFMPGRMTQYKDSFRLLSNQMINYSTGELQFRKLFLPTPSYSKEQCLFEFERLYLHSIHEMTKYYKDAKIWLPISGGYDSRICMAALQKEGIDYSLFTEYDPKQKNAGCYADLKVSQKLAQIANKHLDVIYINKYQHDKCLENEYFRHSSGMTSEYHAAHYSNKHYNSLHLQANNVFINNNLWEIATDNYGYNSYMNTLEKLQYCFDFREDVFKQSLNDWFYIEKKDDINVIPFSVAAYWELRCGCWAADKWQADDIYDTITVIHSFNCRKFIAILFNLDYEYRASKEFEKDLAIRWWPKLEGVPYDKEYSDFWVDLKKFKATSYLSKFMKACFPKNLYNLVKLSSWKC